MLWEKRWGSSTGSTDTGSGPMVLHPDTRITPVQIKQTNRRIISSVLNPSLGWLVYTMPAQTIL